MNKTLDQFTKDERSLLLYLESRCVDHRGFVDGGKMNHEDFKIAKQWAEDGFIQFGRFKAKDWGRTLSRSKYWCQMSDEAHAMAHAERLASARRSVDEVVQEYVK